MAIIVPIRRVALNAWLDAIGQPHGHPPAPQRKPETGERIGEVHVKLAPGKCYICKRHDACIWFSADVPKCAGCHDRFRRKE